MTDTTPQDSPISPRVKVEEEPPVGQITIIYLGPITPHWEIHTAFGDPNLLADFQARVLARLLLLPPHDPQFKRNRERVNRDAARNNVLVEWDLGYDEEEVKPAATEPLV